MISINYNNVCPLQAFLNWLILFIKGFMNIINNDYPGICVFLPQRFQTHQLSRHSGRSPSPNAGAELCH